MQTQIAAWLAALDACTAHAHRLAERAGNDGFNRRPPSGKWSLGEHLAHLNLGTEPYLPIFERLAADPKSGPRDEGRRYRRDVLGALLCWFIAPPVRVRTRTTPAFVPSGEVPRAQTMAAFERLQRELAHRVRALSGLDLNAARVVSPFAENVTYNAWTAVSLLTAHQRRHLWLVEHP